MSNMSNNSKNTAVKPKKQGLFRRLGRQWQLVIMSVPMLLYVLLFNYGPM